MTDVSLRIGGREFKAWKNVEVTRAIDEISGSFSLETAREYSDFSEERETFEPDTECQVLIDGAPVITGHIDRISEDIQPSGSVLSVRGRDAIARAINSSANGPWQFDRGGFLDFMGKLGAPYGVKFASDKPLPKIERFDITPGETVFQVIDRVAKLVGMLPKQGGDGLISFGVPGANKIQTSLTTRPKDFPDAMTVKSARIDHDTTQRFGRYECHGQFIVPWAPGDLRPTVEKTLKATAEDPEIGKDRVLILHSRSQATFAQAKTQTQWEASVRAARSLTVTLTVYGWKDLQEGVWSVGDEIEFNGKPFIISRASFRKSSQSGTTTDLELVPRGAYDQEPVSTKGIFSR